MEARQETHIQKWKLVKIQILGPYGVINQYIEKNKFTIGKKGFADIGLDFKFIEDIHLQVEIKSNNRIYITDLATSRGSFLSRRKLEATTQTKYYPGCEIGFAGMSQAVVLSLIDEGENDHSQAVLKLVDAQKIYETSTINANLLTKENQIEIQDLKQTALDEIKFDKNQMQKELDNLKTTSMANIKLQNENENKKFEKLLKKNIRQVFKYEDKAKKLEHLILDLKKIKNELESENNFNTSELKQKKNILLEANKEISYLKEKFEMNKKNILKTIDQLNANSNNESQNFKDLKNDFKGQIHNLQKKKDDLKNQIAKKQITLKSKSTELKEIETQTKLSIKKVDQLKNKKESLEEKIQRLNDSSGNIISNAKDESYKIMNEAQTQACQLIKLNQKEAEEVLDKASLLSKDHSDQVISLAKTNAKDLIDSSINESKRVKEKAQIEHDQLELKSLCLQEEVEKLENDKIQLTKNFKQTKIEFEKEIEEKQLDEMQRSKLEFDNMQKRRGQMTYKFEQEKQLFQERLDNLGLDYSKALSHKVPKFSNDKQETTKIDQNHIMYKKKNVLMMVVPSLVSFVFAIVLSQFYTSSQSNNRGVASIHKESYSDYHLQINKKTEVKLMNKINKLLTTNFHLNSQKVVEIMRIEKSLLKSIDQSDFKVKQKRDNNKIQSILGSNYQVYQTKKFKFIDNL